MGECVQPTAKPDPQIPLPPGEGKGEGPGLKPKRYDSLSRERERRYPEPGALGRLVPLRPEPENQKKTPDRASGTGRARSAKRSGGKT